MHKSTFSLVKKGIVAGNKPIASVDMGNGNRKTVFSKTLVFSQKWNGKTVYKLF